MVSRSILIVLLLLIHVSVWAAGHGQLSDPLRPLTYAGQSSQVKSEKKAAVQVEKLHLGAVLISADRAVAVINGQPLQVGESIAGYKVKKIEPASVQLQKKQKKMTLRRPGAGLKKAFLSQNVEEGSQP